MSVKIYPYHSGKQFDKMIGQFSRAFSGFQIDNGDGTYERVGVVYGALDRVTAAMMNKRGYFASNRHLPVMSIVNTGLEINTERKQSNRHIDTITQEIQVGLTSSAERIIGTPLTMFMDVSLMCSSKTELYDLLEQILLVFNPRLAVTIDDDKTNADAITEIELVSLSPEINYPLGTDVSTVLCTLSFSFATRLIYPHGVINNLILDIQTNMVTDQPVPPEIV